MLVLFAILVKDLKKLLDDNNRELKSQGGSGGGLPQDLVRLDAPFFEPSFF